MASRAWLHVEFGCAIVYSIPTFLLTLSGAQHVSCYGEPWALYVLSPFIIALWGPGPLLALAAVLQARQRHVQLGWSLSVAAAVLMTGWSIVSLVSFSRQHDVHWVLWTMWIAAACASVATIVGIVSLSRSRIGRADDAA
jgi:hypothetical protein